METASLFIQKVGVALSGTASHVTMIDERKALSFKESLLSRDMPSLIKNLNEKMIYMN